MIKVSIFPRIEIAAFAVTLVMLAGCSSNTTAIRGNANPKGFDNVVDIALYKKAVRENPRNTSYLLNLAQKYIDTMQWSYAAAAFHETLLIAPNSVGALVGYSHALLALEHYQEARKSAFAGLSRERNLKAVLVVAVASGHLGETRKAEAIYHQIIRADPRSLAARNNLALSLAFQGKNDAYAIIKQVALSPDAQMRHKRNLILISAMLGQDQIARKDASAFAISVKLADRIIEIGHKARRNGMGVVGLASAKDL